MLISLVLEGYDMNVIIIYTFANRLLIPLSNRCLKCIQKSKAMEFKVLHIYKKNNECVYNFTSYN